MKFKIMNKTVANSFKLKDINNLNTAQNFCHKIGRLNISNILSYFPYQRYTFTQQPYIQHTFFVSKATSTSVNIINLPLTKPITISLNLSRTFSSLYTRGLFQTFLCPTFCSTRLNTHTKDQNHLHPKNKIIAKRNLLLICHSLLLTSNSRGK